MTSFGSWYDQQRRENGDHTTTTTTNGSTAEGGNSSFFFSSFAMDSEQVLPLFNSESLSGFSLESMRQSMEAQMPKKILGMGYQQRFKVSYVHCFCFCCNSARRAKKKMVCHPMIKHVGVLLICWRLT
jgi:hypothetical protein